MQTPEEKIKELEERVSTLEQENADLYEEIEVYKSLNSSNYDQAQKWQKHFELVKNLANTLMP